MTLKARIWTDASQYTALTALIGTSPFRLFDQRLPQGVAFPAVVMESVANPHAYVAGGQMPTSFTRIQFRIYGTGNDSENAALVGDTLIAFFSTFDGPGTGAPTLPNYVVGDRDMGIAQTDPMTYMRLIDMRIFSNEFATT
jgi:hypothetical protein